MAEEALEELPEAPVPLVLRKFVVLGDNFEADPDYPVGVIEIPPVAFEDQEVGTIAIILLCEVGGRLLALLPHRAWSRTVSKRLIPARYFLKPFTVEVLFSDRAVEEGAPVQRKKAWLGILSPEAEDRVLYDVEAFHPIEPDIGFDPAGLNYLPTAGDLARVTEQYYGFQSATSGGEGAGPGPGDIGSRLTVLEASVQAIADSVKKISTAPSAPLPGRLR